MRTPARTFLMRSYYPSTATLLLRLVVAGLLASSLSGADASVRAKFQRPEYVILRAGAPIKIDGNLDEAAWFGARDVGEFHFPWWKEGKKEQTRAKLLWDDENLYVAFVCEDALITARHTERDGKIPEDDCVEVMVAPNPQTPDIYYNIEFNLLGGILDNFRPNGPSKPRAPKWDAEGVRIAGKYVGTLNDDSDTDQYWQVEVAIPLRNFAEVAGQPRPRDNTVLFLNCNRHGGATNNQASQWSPANSPTRSFHTPDRFGKVIFSDVSSPFGAAVASPYR